jgi:SSS family solute:Na+ symporter
MSVQFIVILLYFAITVIIGIISLKRTKSADSFTGAELGVFAIVASSTGEWLGGTATTGVSEYGFNSGISGAWYTIANGIGVCFLAILFASLYRSLNTISINGIVEAFFGYKARAVSCVALTIVMLAVGLSQMIAAGKLGENLLGVPFVGSVIVFLIIFVVYTLAGGMNAVASTNKLHLIAMYAGVILGLFFTMKLLSENGLSFGEGLDEVEAAIARGYVEGDPDSVAAQVGTGAGKEYNFFGMMTIGVDKVSSWILASLLGACTAQAGLQPVLAAKDVPTARKAAFLTALASAPFGLFTAAMGMGARVLSFNGVLYKEGDAANGNVDAYTLVGEKWTATGGKNALPTLMMNMPGIVGGIVLASILAAILSTVSPIILAAGTMVTKDIYQRLMKPDATDKQVLFMGRVTTALSGVICTIGAIALVNMSAVLEIVYSAYSLRGAIFIVLLLGIYWRKHSERGGIAAIICTTIVAVGWVVIKLKTGAYPIVIPMSSGSFAITETYMAVATAFVTTILFSLIFPRRPGEGVTQKERLQAHAE